MEKSQLYMKSVWMKFWKASWHNKGMRLQGLGGCVFGFVKGWIILLVGTVVVSFQWSWFRTESCVVPSFITLELVSVKHMICNVKLGHKIPWFFSYMHFHLCSIIKGHTFRSLLPCCKNTNIAIKTLNRRASSEGRDWG